MTVVGTDHTTRTDSPLRVWAVFAMCAAIIWLTAGHSPSPDLYATWLAGEFFAQGNATAIYPPDTDIFRMRPPEAWIALETGRGYGGALYPYIYPPLWAALAGLAQGVVTFEQVLPVATAINSALLAGMICLAWNASGRAMPLLLWAAIAMVAVVGTYAGFLAIKQNQPQILVSFLIVLAIERHRAGRTGWAGAALALAAAIKVYPALFVVFYIVVRDWRAVQSFALVGAALAGLSVALAGWPLHVVFLEQLSALSNTILMTPITLTLWATVAQFLDRDLFEYVVSPWIGAATGEAGGWYVMAKGPLLSALSTVAMIALLAGAARLYARRDAGTRAMYLWPAALGLLALISPISWVYHYLPVLAFAPALLIGLGQRAGMLLLLATLLPLSLWVLPHFADVTLVSNPLQLVATLAITAITAGFAVAAIGPRTAPRQATLADA
ncbi:MAG: glycosyltransferase family 87 protein [Pseudomonadota bacterium]